MRLVRYRDADGVLFVGRLEDETVVPHSRPDGTGDRELLEIAMRGDPGPALGPSVPTSAVRLLAPLGRPPTIRDFLTFEQHYANFLEGSRGSAEIPTEWYRTPVFYFSTPHRIFGPEDQVPSPATEQLDYELEVAAVLGADGSDVDPGEAADLIAGYTIFNDLSARDIQAVEMPLGLGPSKCKDFANVFGPCLATPDELGGTPGRPSARLSGGVNGKTYGEDRLEAMQHSFAEMIAHASRSSAVRAGDIFGSGTCATGCILELSSLHGPQAYPWLEPGDVVELEAEGIGVLRTVIGPRPA
jgi:2-keto-4-pentenoate hydratase/2-oxohepta-3-ene-1,7-dioic acid hydratase in catechol pathway